jgi:hypothetical protein
MRYSIVDIEGNPPPVLVSNITFKQINVFKAKDVFVNTNCKDSLASRQAMVERLVSLHFH